MQTTKTNIWLDCDPGHDDMFAIILAAMNQKINLLGISTSAGNSTIKHTTQNALNILAELGRTDVRVYKGSQTPLCAELKTAPEVHGETGLTGAILKLSPQRAVEKNVFWEIYNVISSTEGKLNFVVTGAMTNLAILIRAFPDIITKLSGITIMGGAVGIGNMTPSAEFNIYVDPEAAVIVFNSGVKVTMVPLQVTHTALITAEIFHEMKEINTEFSEKLYKLSIEFQKKYKEMQDFDFPPAHDPCTIYYLLHPENFNGRDCFVEIEVSGKSRGRTNCKFSHMNRPANCFVCEKINVEHFWETMMAAVKKVK